MIFQKKAKKETVRCKYCERKFKRERSHGVYCSDKCRTYAWNDRHPRVKIEEQIAS